MKYFISFLFILIAAASARADFNTSFGATSTAYPNETYGVGGDAEETDNGDAFVEVSIYKDGYLMAYASDQGHGDPPVSAGAGFDDSGGGSYSGHMTGGGDVWYSVNTEIIGNPVPNTLAASNLTPTSFLLTWLVSPSSAECEVSRDGVSLGWAYGLSRSITGLQQGHTYAMQVRSAYTQVSEWSQPFYVTLSDTTPPTAPVLQAPTHTASSATLSWSASTDAGGLAGYQIYMIYAGSSWGVGYTSASVTTFTHARFPGTTRSYFVMAVDGFGNSTASNTVTSTTPASSDSDSDGIPDQLEALFNNANPVSDSSILLRTHRPN